MVELAGDSVNLHSVKSTDIKKILDWSIETKDSFFLLNSPLPITSEDLILELNAPDRILYFIEDKKNNPLGLVRVFNTSSFTKRSSLAFTMQTSQNNAKLMQEALEIILERLFEKQKVTKIYTQCLAYESELKTVLTRLFYKKEGTFKKHHFLHNQYYDVDIFGLSKEDYYR